MRLLIATIVFAMAVFLAAGVTIAQLSMFALDLIKLAIVLVVYFLPSVIAVVRDARHQPAILALNLLLGWTIFGWIAALLWAVAEARKVSAAPEY